MDLISAQSSNAVIYVENIYEGNLNRDSVDAVNIISQTNWLRIWMQYLNPSLNEPLGYELSLRLTSDSQIRLLNSQYRGIDKPTDVLAFAATESTIALPADLDEPLYLGDIIVSLDTAWRQAKEQNHSLITELAWLTSHGLLHLLGWDHPDDLALREMLEQQARLIELLEL